VLYRSASHRLLDAALLCLVLYASAAAAENPPSQIELNGFLLGQYVKMLDSTFGTPFQEEMTEDGLAYRAYVLSKESQGYMVFQSTTERPQYIFSIQITGKVGTNTTPFLGLRLGDDKSKVLQVLGKPSKVKRVQELKLEYLTYKNRNYSVEIDEEGRLYSIRILGFEGFPEKPKEFPKIEGFKRCVVDRDVDCLLTQLAPDFEVYKEGQLYTFTSGARTELMNPESPVVRLLLGDKDSVRAVFAEERSPGESEFRMYEKGSIDVVFKFYKSKIISEIVYTTFAGQSRVWEIRFR